jgi:glycosyltransferase involved in cell wall biosynthesis
MAVRVSVVVPTYKRPELLDRCLAALVAQDYDPSLYEIMVADDAASCDTRRQVECLAAKATCSGRTIHYVPVTGAHGPAAARNAGWRAARGDIIAFTDDDCIPAPGWLRAAMCSFADGVVGIMGTTRAPLKGTPTDYELNVAGLEGGEFLTANCFYRRCALEEAGGFDERFTMAYREDTDVWLSLLERDSRLVRAPEAEVLHPIRPAPWGVSLSQQRRSMFNMLLYKKHPTMYIRRVAPGPPWHYYRTVGALLVSVAALLGGHRWPALVAGGAWAYMTGCFCLRRLERTSHAPGHVAEMALTSILIPPLSIFWRLYGAIKYRVAFL